jgi:hypothetical protein
MNLKANLCAALIPLTVIVVLCAMLFAAFLWAIDLNAVDHHTEPEFRYVTVGISLIALFCVVGSYFLLRKCANVILRSED